MNHEEFVQRWQRSGGAELANSQSFLKELSQLLEVPEPDPTQTDETLNTYVFEKAVSINNGDGTYSTGRVDLYRQKCFVLESKQGAERRANELAEALATVTKQKRQRKGTAQRGTAQWAQAMRSAFQQAKRYAEALPEWPPFLIICDVGYCFDVYADFSGTGKNYSPFPDPVSFRIPLQDLTKEAKQRFLKAIWLAPQSLDPSKISARVTRELANRLAKLARSLEKRDATEDADHRAHQVAQFLMRCLFTMFAEDVELIPKGAFLGLLESLRGDTGNFVPMVETLWKTMDKGGFSPILRQKLLQFNGGLFADSTALPLNDDQLELLIEAAKANWAEVEPAIFGTLLERALDPRERHKLGAHYTPRAYVERLVMPTIIEPLREEWDNVYATAAALFSDAARTIDLAADHESDQKRVDAQKIATQKRNEARSTVRAFHRKLCNIRILDPACGSGNFLYVSLELMKRLEAEVVRSMRDLGDTDKILTTIDPHQFLGIEVNPRAVAVADLVLWIGYLQWHIRAFTRESLAEPVIQSFHNIDHRDAVLAWDSIEPVVDEDGNPVTRWDGHTTKRHPVTGEEVPDETARVQELRYINPRKAEWPQADYIVGNPPFIGNKRMRFHLGDGYVDALRRTYKKDIPESADYVMIWWGVAADAVIQHSCRRFGLIATNSLTQVYNRKVVQQFLDAGDENKLVFAIPDHPWVDSADGAAVRISMTVAQQGNGLGHLLKVCEESNGDDSETNVVLIETRGDISADLSVGAATSETILLLANQGISTQGVTPLGKGFRLGVGDLAKLNIDRHCLLPVVKKYMIGRDIVRAPEEKYIIDFFGLSLDDARNLYPALLQIVTLTVKPERDAKVGRSKDADQYAKEWWLFAKTRSSFRPALVGLQRYIATCRTAKHRLFTFLSIDIIPDAKLVAIAIAAADVLGVLSSRIHVVWAMKTGGWLGVGNDSNYNHSDCFGKFPFPALQSSHHDRIAALAEQLDSHRKRQQALHPDLTMTGMYNVLEKLRSGEELTAKERAIHEKGLVSVLKQIHDDLDAAVFDAYGWPHDLTDEEILERLVALNHERAEEEKRGLIRWLRPEFQNPAGGKQAIQTELELDGDADSDPDDDDSADVQPGKKGKTKAAKAKPAKAKAAAKTPWPKTLPEQVAGVRQMLQQQTGPTSPAGIAKAFKAGKAAVVEELLDTLVAIGQARLLPDGRYAT